MEAVKLVRFIHRTLKSADFRFLLHNYMAESALVSCKVDEKIHSMVLLTRGNQINVYSIESPSVPTSDELSSIKGENLIGYFSNFREIRISREKIPFENVLLFQPYLIRMVMVFRFL